MKREGAEFRGPHFSSYEKPLDNPYIVARDPKNCGSCIYLTKKQDEPYCKFKRALIADTLVCPGPVVANERIVTVEGIRS